MNTLRSLMAVTVFALVAPGAIGQAKLKVLDPAPPLKVAKWVKGQEINALEKGNVYVVEFWATWCGPCRVSIPHLTEMAHKYKDKITFIGVDCYERPSSPTDTAYFAKVDQFVKDMGDKMDYNVCIDGPENTMGSTWMEAAGQNGIPTAFVVGKEGTIQWIGHPMSMDAVLDPIVAGTFDAKAAATEREQAEAKQAEQQKLMAPVADAYRKKDWPKALAAVNSIMASHPDMADDLSMLKFNILQMSDEKAMYAYARKLADTTYKGNAAALNALAWPMVDPKSRLKTRNYDTALYIAQRAAQASNNADPSVLDTLAVAYFRKGNVTKAIETQKRAIALLDKPGANVPDETKQEIRARLAEFRKKR